MKYQVTFSCGHTETVDLVGKQADRDSKIEYFGKYGICKECYKAKKANEQNEKIEAMREQGWTSERIRYTNFDSENIVIFPNSYDADTKTFEVFTKITKLPEGKKGYTMVKGEKKACTMYALENPYTCRKARMIVCDDGYCAFVVGATSLVRQSVETIKEELVEFDVAELDTYLNAMLEKINKLEFEKANTVEYVVVKVSYADYKNKYSNCKKVANSYNAKEKTIEIYLEKDKLSTLDEKDEYPF